MAEKPKPIRAAGDTVKVSRVRPAKDPSTVEPPPMEPYSRTANKAVVIRKPRSAASKTAPATTSAAAAPAPIAPSSPPASGSTVGGLVAKNTPPATDRREVKPILERNHLIALAAYFRAEKRHFSHGHDQSDWFIAEQDVDGRYRFV